jgi:cell division initiation protein
MVIVITGEGVFLMNDNFSIQENGYNKDEVKVFIDDVITMLDELNRDHKQTVTENQLLRDQLSRFDEIKAQINEVLLSAQTVASDIKTQALAEQATILNNAHTEARRVVSEKLVQANDLEQQINVYKARLKSIITSQLELLDDIE